MAGSAKPKYEVNTEARYSLIGGSAQNGSPSGLFDGTTPNAWNTTTVFYWNDSTSWVEIEFLDRFRLHRYYSWSNSNNQRLKIFKHDGVGYNIDLTAMHLDISKQTTLTWMRFTETLEAGKYRFVLDAASTGFNGRVDGEWYAERMTLNKILLSSGDKLFSIKQGSPRENLVPVMTNYTLPSGKAEASTTYSSYYAWKAFDRVDDSYGWLSNAITGWLKYTFQSATLIQAYTIKSGNNSTTRTPKSWTFEGSNDDTNWTVLDTRTNETNWSTGEKRSYIFKNKTKFFMYRINVTSNNGDTSYVSIGEMEMMELGLSIVSYFSNRNESTFLSYGMESGNLSVLADKMKLYNSNSAVLSSGKTFEHTIDMSKQRIDMITL